MSIAYALHYLTKFSRLFLAYRSNGVQMYTHSVIMNAGQRTPRRMLKSKQNLYTPLFDTGKQIIRFQCLVHGLFMHLLEGATRMIQPPQTNT